MCLMQTDLPVPDGPRIIEILPSGRPMFSPRRILLRPNALWTSMNSMASGTPVGRFRPVCQWYSSSWPRSASCTTDTRAASASASGCSAWNRATAGGRSGSSTPAPVLASASTAASRSLMRPSNDSPSS